MVVWKSCYIPKVIGVGQLVFRFTFKPLSDVYFSGALFRFDEVEVKLVNFEPQVGHSVLVRCCRVHLVSPEAVSLEPGGQL